MALSGAKQYGLGQEPPASFLEIMSKNCFFKEIAICLQHENTLPSRMVRGSFPPLAVFFLRFYRGPHGLDVLMVKVWKPGLPRGAISVRTLVWRPPPSTRRRRILAFGSTHPKQLLALKHGAFAMKAKRLPVPFWGLTAPSDRPSTRISFPNPSLGTPSLGESPPSSKHIPLHPSGCSSFCSIEDPGES